MLLKKILHTTSTFAALGILLGSTCLSPVWAMNVDDIGCSVVRTIAKKEVHFEGFGKLMVTDWDNLCKCRLVSHSWRAATDKVIRINKLFSLKLSPENYRLDSLEHMASLSTTLSLVQWSEDNSKFISNALSQENKLHENFFSRTLKFFYSESLDPSLLNPKIVAEGVVALGSGLKKMTQLESLALTIAMDAKDIQSLTQSLCSLSQLTHLAFGCVNGEEGGEAVGKMLSHLTALKTIHIKGLMGPLGTEKFTKDLFSLTNLKKLDLSYNEIGDKGAIALGKQLKHLTNLQHLVIMKNLDSFEAEASGIESWAPHEEGERYLQKKAKKHNPTLKITWF